VLFAGFTSLVVGAMLEVFVILVPEAVPALTLTTRGNVSDVPAGKVEPTVQTPAAPAQQLIVPVPPTAGRAVQITPAGSASDTKVVFAGTELVNTGFDALAGPAFESVSKNVMLFPAETGLGEPEMVSIRSNCPAVATVTVTVELLVIGFESGVVEVVLAVFEIFVPDVVPAATVPITVKVVLLPELNVPSVHCRVTVNAGRHDQAVPV
jgi:hypothetical protein